MELLRKFLEYLGKSPKLPGKSAELPVKFSEQKMYVNKTSLILAAMGRGDCAMVRLTSSYLHLYRYNAVLPTFPAFSIISTCKFRVS